MTNEQLDVGMVLAQLRQEVLAAHAGLDDANGHVASRVDRSMLAESVAEVEALRAVSIHWPLTWQTSRERIEVFLQRVIRRALQFYLEPIVQQQNAYNAAVARTINLLYQAQQETAAELARLKQQAHVSDGQPGKS